MAKMRGMIVPEARGGPVPMSEDHLDSEATMGEWFRIHRAADSSPPRPPRNNRDHSRSA